MRILVIPLRETVRDPKTTQPLTVAGQIKEDSQYWRRRERDGDVKIEPEPSAAAPDLADTKAKK